MFYRVLAILFTATALIFTLACGNKGPLYLPAKEPTVTQPVASTAKAEPTETPTVETESAPQNENVTNSDLPASTDDAVTDNQL